jgi:tRNA dimethylallyltransferase
MENYQLSDTARAGIGYKELIDAIESSGDIELALDLIKQKSRNYAKRQLTWFGRNKDVHWFYRDQMSDEALLQNAIDLADKFLKGGNE